MTRAGHPGDGRARHSCHSSAPRLETERLILRSFERRDLDDFAATLADPDVVRHLAIEPMSREDAFRRLLLAAGQWPILGMGMWAIESKASGRVVGHCGFFDMERDMEPSIRGEPEAGWIFDRSVHGQGVAFEACTAALAWADSNLDADTIPAIIAPGNSASMRLAERLGFVRQPDATYKDEPIALFRRPRP